MPITRRATELTKQAGLLGKALELGGKAFSAINSPYAMGGLMAMGHIPGVVNGEESVGQAAGGLTGDLLGWQVGQTALDKVLHVRVPKKWKEMHWSNWFDKGYKRNLLARAGIFGAKMLIPMVTTAPLGGHIGEQLGNKICDYKFNNKQDVTGGTQPTVTNDNSRGKKYDG